MATREPARDREPVHRDTLFTVALIVVRLVILALFLAEIRRGNYGGPDVVRFRTLARLEGTPWHDYPVEYAPLEYLLIKALFGVGIMGAAARLAVLAVVADLATWGAVRTEWGRRAGLIYLSIGLPVAILAMQRIDLVPVAITTWAFVLLRRSRPRSGAAALAFAVLMKVWPLVLLPGLWIRGRSRSLLSFVVVTATGLMAWTWWGGTGAFSQVLGFRGATGWEAGSTVGTLVWVIGGGPVREEAGAGRVGTAPVWAKVALGLALLAILLWIWRRAEASGRDLDGEPALTSVAALLLLSPLFSAQYVLWLLPWAAVSALDDDRPAVPLVMTFLICAATAVIATFLYDSSSDALVKVASVARIALLGGLVVRGMGVRVARPPEV
jgi:Glycosyltransferase family 87